MPTAAATSSSRVSAKPRSAKSASAAARIAARVRSERAFVRGGRSWAWLTGANLPARR